MRELQLATHRPFAALVTVMVAGAANDNLVKTVFVVAVTVAGWERLGLDPVLLANVAALCFILPFVLLAGPSVALADQVPFRRLLFLLKACEVVLAGLAMIAIWQQSMLLLLGVVAAFGVQSALIGPIKYAWIPRLAGPDQLPAYNAWMASGTFVAILMGSAFGADGLISAPNLVMGAMLALSLVGLVGVIGLPDLNTTVGTGPWHLRSLLASTQSKPAVQSSIWCISGFWGLGSAWLTHLPSLATEVWFSPPESIGTLLAAFVAGIAVGAAASAAFKQSPALTRILAGALTVVIGALWVLLAPVAFAPLGLLATAAGGGAMALPLYVNLQRDVTQVSRHVAVNNVANALMMMAVALCSMLAVAGFGLSIPLWLLILALGQLGLCLHHRRNLRLG